MEQNEADQPVVVYPNRSFADYSIAGLLFLVALVVTVYLLATAARYRFGEDSGLAVVVLALVVLPAVIGGLWLAWALNTSITVTSKGLVLRNFAGRARYVWWNSIDEMCWLQWHPRSAGMLELTFTDDGGRQCTISFGPRTHETRQQLQWLRDHITKQSGLKKMETHRRDDAGRVLDPRPTHIWRRPADEWK